MQNSNDDRFFKKDGKTVNKKYIAKKNSQIADKKLFSKWFVLFLILLALATIFYNIYNHSYFKVKEVYVSGNHETDNTEIITSLNNPIGKNILLYNPDEYVANIKALDYVKDASVSKVFPNLISVNISESYPLYYVSKNNQTYIISNDGKLLEISEGEIETNDLIKISGANVKETVGENFTGSEASLDLIQKIQEVYYFNALKELNLENKADIGIMLHDIDVKFGDLNNIDYKLKLLGKVLNDIEEKGITAVEIDLKDKENPVVKVASDSFSENLNY